MKRRAFIPSPVLRLEERLALSHGGLVPAVAHQPALIRSQSLNLYGLVLGSDKTVGTLHQFKASGGTISPLGLVSLAGFLMIPHKVGANRAVHGVVTFSNAHGSVAVSLTGKVTVYKSRFWFASGNLSYRIVAGTKDYQGAKGAGPVLYGPGPVFIPGRFMLDFGNYPPPP
jgi:hypothetical protein